MTNSSENQSDKIETEQKEQSNPIETGTRVELWIRAEPPYCVHDVQERTYERLQSLQEAGHIASVTTHLWSPIETTPKKMPQEHAAVTRERVADFEAWANEHGYSLRPGFKTQTKRAIFAEEDREILIPPMLCLAVYAHDELGTVFPYTDSECVYTVGDGLNRLETEAEDPTAGGVTA